MMPERSMSTSIAIGLLVGAACVACTPADASTSLPRFESLEETRQAVSEAMDCAEKALEPTQVHDEAGLFTTDSAKCTDSVEVFYFESEDSKAKTYSILADADGTVSFVEGQNWFVVDYSQVATNEGKSRPADFARLASELDARFTEVK